MRNYLSVMELFNLIYVIVLSEKICYYCLENISQVIFFLQEDVWLLPTVIRPFHMSMQSYNTTSFNFNYVFLNCNNAIILVKINAPNFWDIIIKFLY